MTRMWRWAWVVLWLIGLVFFPPSLGMPLLAAYVVGGLGLGVATGALRLPAGLALDERRIRERLRKADLGELPSELQGVTPRRDVFTGRGHLADPSLAARTVHLLVNGDVARALVLKRTTKNARGQVHVTVEYAWVEHGDRLRREILHESYDPELAAKPAVERGMIVDVDAPLREGHAVTVAHDRHSGRHVIYEALLVDAA